MIICGNGFDLHHGLKTSYGAYREFLEKTSPALLREYEGFPYLSVTDAPWSDVEEALNIDYETLMVYSVASYYPDVLNNDSDSRWSDLEIDIENLSRFTYDFTGKRFFSWLYGVPVGQVKPDMPLQKTDCYITFNYTNTLEVAYGIPSSNVFHIHGSLSDVLNKNILLDQSVLPSFSSQEEAELKAGEDIPADKFNNGMVRQYIQFGAVGTTPQQVDKDLGRIYGQDEFYAVSIEPAIQQLKLFCENTSKDLYKNYGPLQNFIKDTPVDEIIIIGHSLTGVDFPYYRDILAPCFEQCKWTIMCHDSENFRDAECFIHELNLQNAHTEAW